MPSATRTITIARPPAEVFAYVAEGGNARAWRPGVLDVEHVSGVGAGALYRQGVKGPGGRRIPADYEVTAFEPGARIAFRAVAGPVRPVGEYRFEPDGAGTAITFSLEATLTGWKKLLMGGAVQSTMNAEMGNLDRLKQILEA